MGYEQQITTAVAEVERGEEVSPHITLSSGVVLRLKKVPILRIQAIVNKIKYPPVPSVWDEEKQREYKNPNSPDYTEAVRLVNEERGMAAIDAVAAFGTELVSVPENVIPLESDEWVEELNLFGLDVNISTPKARYLAWIKYVAVIDQEDLGKLGRQFGLSLGISEDRVANALEQSFQDNP